MTHGPIVIIFLTKHGILRGRSIWAESATNSVFTETRGISLQFKINYEGENYKYLLSG